MNDYEMKILREIANPGSVEGLMWGAAMLAALGFLRRDGYVEIGDPMVLTEKGRKALEASQ